MESTSKSHELWGPVVVGSLLFHVVSDENHVPRAEVWSGCRWVRSSFDTLGGLSVLDLLRARRATTAELAAAGITATDAA